MKEENNIKVLDEVNKGCAMGMDALKDILEKAEGKKFKETLEKHYEKYDKLSEKIRDLYDEYCESGPDETSKMEKTMTWYGIQMRTITDSSTSKLAELLMQGTNMGIIEGRKILNHKDVDKKVNNIVDEFVKMQEKNVEELKEFL